MLELLLFAPCRIAVQDSTTNTMSVISVLEDLNIPVNLETPPTKGTVFPVDWNVVSLWRNVEEGVGDDYEQNIELVAPSGAVLMTAPTSFQMKQRAHRIIAQIAAFPAWEAGEFTLRVSLRKKGDERWQLMAKYPLRLNYIGQESAASD